MRAKLGAIVLVCGVLITAAVGAEKEGRPAPSYAADVEPIFLKRCVDCHAADKPKAQLVLAEGRGYENLVGVPSLQAPDVVRVAPGDPEASYLWLKLTHRPREGKGMPRTLFGSKKLPKRELELVRAWIEAGANP